MKIQTLVAAIALAVAGGAFAAPGASTSTDPKPGMSGMSGSDMKAGDQANGKMHRQRHQAKQRAAHGHRDGASGGHIDKSGHHAGMSHMEMSKHMNSPHHMGASTGRMEPDMDDSQRRVRMDEAYANWRKSNG